MFTGTQLLDIKNKIEEDTGCFMICINKNLYL
jgi:hypothetical protein